jgi:hypothetical protein
MFILCKDADFSILKSAKCYKRKGISSSNLKAEKNPAIHYQF